MNSDTITHDQCTFKLSEVEFVKILVLPLCFIQLEGIRLNNNESLYSIH